MRKKKEMADNTPTSEQQPARPQRRAKLIKKRVRSSSEFSTEEEASPHLVSWGGFQGHPDESSGSVEERIATRAYERFLGRGGHHGQDLQDWLEAEREVLSESGCCS